AVDVLTACSRYSPSSKKSSISAHSASSASSACSPSPCRRSGVPLPAASIITDMMLLPSTRLLSQRPRRLWQGKRLATPPHLAAARACRPSLLMMVMSRAGMGWSLVQIAMANLHVLQQWTQGLSEAFGQVDRAVLAASATNSHGDIGAIARGKAWQPLVQVGQQV